MFGKDFEKMCKRHRAINEELITRFALKIKDIRSADIMIAHLTTLKTLMKKEDFDEFFSEVNTITDKFSQEIKDA